MGRPPGSKNGQKSARKQGNGAGATPRAETRKQSAVAAAPPPKSNSGPTPDERAGWLGEFTRLDTEKQRISGDISALATRVKAKGGVKAWKSLKWVHASSHNKDEAREFLEDLVVAAAQQDIRISWMGNQATFADIMDQPEAKSPPVDSVGAESLAVARAHSDGFNSGRNGAVPSDNPFRNAPGSAEYVSWHNGRDDGQQAREQTKPAEAKRLKDAIAADATLPNESPPAAEEPIF